MHKISGMLCFSSLIIALCLLICSAESTGPKVKIDKAEIIGQTVDFENIEVNEFLSIRYAEPPTGKLRFKPSIPLSSYEGTIMAKTLPPACPQYTENPFPWYYPGPEQSEDCLYLNIWAPAGASGHDKKAVIYWIYGGGDRYGTIRDKLFNGTALSALGDVIVVTVNYRLGVLGYLYSGTKDAPGNAALWDRALGLQWVNKYIHAFGGDTSRITVAGESGGSMGTGLLKVSPVSKNLFHRMITESGAPQRAFDNGTNNLMLAEKLAPLVGCGNETYRMRDHPKKVTRCLRETDYEKLIKADSYVVPHYVASFQPIFGDTFLPEDFKFVIKRENFDCGSLLTGVNKEEGTNLASSSYPDIFGFFGEKNPKINRSQAAAMIADAASAHNPSTAEDAVKFYLPDGVKNKRNKFRKQVCDAYGDYFIVCPTEEFARQCSRNSKVFFYKFLHIPSTSPWAKWEGSTHFSEVEFVFGKPLLFPELYEQDEVDLSRRIIEIWSHFAKFGSPGEPWPLFSASNQVAVNLDVGGMSTSGKAPHLKNCEFVSKASGLV